MNQLMIGHNCAIIVSFINDHDPATTTDIQLRGCRCCVILPAGTKLLVKYINKCHVIKKFVMSGFTMFDQQEDWRKILKALKKHPLEVLDVSNNEYVSHLQTQLIENLPNTICKLGLSNIEFVAYDDAKIRMCCFNSHALRHYLKNTNTLHTFEFKNCSFGAGAFNHFMDALSCNSSLRELITGDSISRIPSYIDRRNRNEIFIDIIAKKTNIHTVREYPLYWDFIHRAIRVKRDAIRHKISLLFQQHCLPLEMIAMILRYVNLPPEYLGE